MITSYYGHRRRQGSNDKQQGATAIAPHEWNTAKCEYNSSKLIHMEKILAYIRRQLYIGTIRSWSTIACCTGYNRRRPPRRVNVIRVPHTQIQSHGLHGGHSNLPLAERSLANGGIAYIKRWIGRRLRRHVSLDSMRMQVICISHRVCEFTIFEQNENEIILLWNRIPSEKDFLSAYLSDLDVCMKVNGHVCI